MNREDWSQARSLFEEAIELEPGKRESFVLEACAEAEPIAELVRELLAAHDTSEHALEPPTDAELRGIGGAGQVPGAILEVPGAPERIGAYHIVRRVGVGGMGTIYEARQDSPQRSVALKIMREGFSSERHSRRFLFEAELLGRLQHENIARVLESGIHTMEGGAQLPWFALEFVPDALSILDFAKQHQLSLEDRIQLFLKACAGVQHGHQKGIIHRDLKASNILVGEDRSPKVIDFGVAFSVEGDRGTDVELTLSGEVVGTLGAMSPEQLRGSRQDVDSCSDVYSLGALLFELLAGEPALDLRGLSLPVAFQKAHEGKLRDLREVCPDLPLELEWIVRRAMEPERERRYPFVSELAADLQRFLVNEPVLAGPVTTTYHFRKFVRRHRLPVFAASAALLVLFGALVWISTIYTVADRERNRFQAINEFMGRALYSADPEFDGPETRVVDVLDRVFDLSAQRFKDQPEVRAELLDTVGRIYFSLGEFQLSIDHLEESLALRKSVGETDSFEVYSAMVAVGLARLWEQTGARRAGEMVREAHEGLVRVRGARDRETLTAQNVLGFALSMASRKEEAEVQLRASYDAAVEAYGQDSTLAVSLGARLGEFLRDQGGIEEAESLARRAYEVHQVQSGAEHPDTIAAGNNLAGVLLLLGRAEEGLDLMRSVHDTARAILGPDRHQTQRLASVFGHVLIGSGDSKAARKVFELAVEECTLHYGELHTLTLNAHVGLGTAAYFDSDLRTAEQELRHALEGFERSIGAETVFTLRPRNTLAMILQKANRIEEAEDLLQLNLELSLALRGDGHQGTMLALGNLGFLMLKNNRPEEAIDLIDEALAGTRRNLGDRHPDTVNLIINAAEARLKMGLAAESIPYWEEALRAGPEAMGEDSSQLKFARRRLDAALLVE